MESIVDLRPLLKPRSIAVIGASQKPARIGRIIFERLLRADRPVYPVHPTAESVLGRRAFANVDQLPTDVDLAVVAVSAERTVEATWACGRKGIPFVIPVAGGFGEVGPVGERLEAELLEVRREHGTRILGPNTLGIFLPHERLDTVFVEHGDNALAAGGGVTPFDGGMIGLIIG